MPTTTDLEIMRRERHVAEVYTALVNRRSAARLAQTVLDDLVASGRVDVAHTNPCWVALEDELHWIGLHVEAIENPVLSSLDNYDEVALFSPEMIARGTGPAPAPSPVVPL